MPEPKIERYELITVESTEKNQYGDLLVNGKLKVGNKRSQLFDIFQPGAEIKIGWASYMNKEYIASAEQTGTHVVIPVSTSTEIPKKSETPLQNTKDRAVSISYAKDLVVGGIIDLKDLTIYADKFLNYILNQEVKKSRLIEAAKAMGAEEIKKGA